MKPHKISFGVRSKLTALLVLFTAGVMALVVWRVQAEVSSTLDKEIKERGIALARNLASSCIEPMEIGEGKELALLLLAKDYIQVGGDEQARKNMYENRTMTGMIIDGVKAKGKEAAVSGVRNEGVLSVAVVDTATNIIACADAVLPQEQWMEKLGAPFVPESDAGYLPPEEDTAIWPSMSRNGVFIIAVPISKRAPEMGEDALPEDGLGAEPGEQVPPKMLYYGSVYLTMTQSLVTRKVALAVANLIIWAGIILLVGILATVLISGSLARPIRLIQRGVRAIASGDFEQKIRLRRAWRDELMELTDAFNDMAKGLKERELMRGAFSTYVSQDLLAEIIKNPEAMKVGGARRSASVLFSFFSEHSKFMAATEKMEPEFVVRLINAYLELQAKMVKEQHGYLDKFIGEEVMAVFGIPTERLDHAKLAVRCAVSIKKAVEELNRARTKQGLITNQVSIGVNSGWMVAGNMGSAGSKLDYTVIGDTVNTAARLGQNAKGNQVLISLSTYNLVKDEAVVSELAPIRVKGKEEPLRIFEVLDMKAPASAGAAKPS